MILKEKRMQKNAEVGKKFINETYHFKKFSQKSDNTIIL